MCLIKTHHHNEHSGGNAKLQAIEAVVRADFDWEDFHVESGLDGLIDEFR